MKILIINSKKHGIKEVLLDDEDYDRVSKYKWYVYKHNFRKTFKFYVVMIEKIGDTKRNKQLSRFIMNSTDTNILIDHINGDTLDNRKENLRNCTNEQNLRNRGSTKSISKYKGVHILKSRDKIYWRARIRINNFSKSLGLFEYTEQGKIEVALAYNKAAYEIDKEFAYLNMIDEVKKEKENNTI